MNRRKFFAVMQGVGDSVAPTFTIEALSAVANVVAMQITASEEVAGFAVGDITISAGGSLSNFATADNTVFTVDWTLAVGENTVDIDAAVCQDLAGNDNVSADQFIAGFVTLQPAAAAGLDAYIIDNPTYKTFNWGLHTSINVGQDVAGTKKRGLLQFDLTSIPGSTILESIVTLYASAETTSTDYDVGFYRGLTPWEEGDQDGANPPGNGCNWPYANALGAVAWAGGDGGASGSDWVATATDINTIDATGKTFNYNVTSDVQGFVDGTYSNYGWRVHNVSEATGSSEKDFTSSDGATAGNRPKITVVYVNPT